MATSSSNVYQFKITLLGPKPKVWRRIQVPETCSFFELHVAVQDAMGWEDYHLHRFEMMKPGTKHRVMIGVPDDAYDEEILSERDTKLAEFFKTTNNTKARYTYDFGMDWEHDIVLEKIIPAKPGTKYPQCVAGRTRCPAEDGNDSDQDQEPVAFNPKAVVFHDPARRMNFYFP